MISFSNISDIHVDIISLKSRFSIFLKFTKTDTVENYFFNDLVSSFFNGNIISIPDVWFRYIELPCDAFITFVSNNFFFVPHTFSYYFNSGVWSTNSLPNIVYLLQQHSSLWWFVKLLALVSSSIIILGLVAIIIALLLWLTNFIKYIFNNLVNKWLIILFTIFLLVGNVNAFSFSDRITEHTSLSLHDVQIIILVVSGAIMTVFGTLFDYYTILIHVTQTISGHDMFSSFDSFWHRLLLNTAGFVWLQADVFFTNTLYTVTGAVSDLVAFIVGGVLSIFFTTIWDYLSVATSTAGGNFFNSFLRALLDSSSFTGIVYSTFVSWAWYNISNITRITSFFIATPLAILSAYLLHLQMLVRVFPSPSNLILSSPNVFIGRWIFNINNLNINDQIYVNRRGWPLFLQSMYFSILWTVTWNIVVFSTNPLIEWWTIFVNNSPYSNNILNSFILLLCFLINIGTTPNFYFRFTEPNRVTTLRLFWMSVQLYIFTSSYIMFNAIIYNMFWPM